MTNQEDFPVPVTKPNLEQQLTPGVPGAVGEDVGEIAMQGVGVGEPTHSPLKRLQALYEGLDDNQRLLDLSLQDKIDALNEEDRKKFESWQVEASAVRTPNLLQIVAELGPDPHGTKMTRVPTEKMEPVTKALERYVHFTEVPSLEDIQTGIARAKAFIDSGQAAAQLNNEPFIGEKQAQEISRDMKRVAMLQLPEPLFIDPSQIKGVAGHDSWMGRGTHGNESMRDRQTGESKSSFEMICDYATRETQLPQIGSDGEVVIYNTSDGPVLFATNAHRVSAAKLRGEPLAVTGFTLYQ